MYKIFLITTLLSCHLISFSQLPDEGDTLETINSLNYDNIKGIPDSGDTLRFCYLSVNIDIKILKMNPWTGKATFKANVNQDSKQSWIKTDYKNNENLEYLRTMYLLSELYAYRLESYMNEKYMPIGNTLENTMHQAKREYNEKLKSEISKFEIETEYGKNRIVISSWSNNVMNDLKKYK